MDDAVRREDVGRRHVHGVVQHHAAIDDRNADVRALNRGRRAERHDVSGRDRSRHHVVKQDVGQRRDVCQQSIDRAGRQLREGLVRGREHRERSVTLERLHQAGRCERRGQRVAVQAPAAVHAARTGDQMSYSHEAMLLNCEKETPKGWMLAPTSSWIRKNSARRTTI